MSDTNAYWVSVVPNKALPYTFHASFKTEGVAQRWVMDRGSRKVFTRREEAELAACRLMIAALNGVGAASEFSARTDGKIRAFRAPDVGRRTRPFKDKISEADVVFANFKKDT